MSNNNKTTKKSGLFDGLSRQNIVLMSGIAIAPVAVVANNFHNSAALALGFTIIALLGVTACRFIPKKIVYTVRVIIYALIAGLAVIPAYLALRHFYGMEMVENLGVYLPLMAVNPLILTKTETRFSLRPPHLMLVELLGYIMGFNIVCVAVGTTRDVLVNRQIGAIHFDVGFEVPALSSTFGGLIIIGIAAGAFRQQYNMRKARKIRKAEKERLRRKMIEEL
ncbi:MAG: NADH:ubiquinone oxidoreductase subunit RnfE [Oscillospiraceae bacterium]|nr:NADH:ubiquinone oxidoreductase subunit RnfE [Oscillospiraceae bacterium]